MKSETEAYVTKIERRLRGGGADVRGVVRVADGEAATILAVAAEEKATLIAMATHGRSGLSRFVFGSVAEKVLRASETPVLLTRSFREVAPGADPTPVQELPFRKILMPVDGSESSLAVLPQVRSFALAVGASVLVLGVLAPEQEAGEGDAIVRMAVKALAVAGIPVEPLVRIGDPASEILDAAKTHGADMLTMSTHGRGGVSRWALGSVTEKVLRAATVPMLVVRASRPHEG